MRKRILWLAAILTFCGTIVLTSCNSEEDSQESRDMRSKIQNTRWKMTEIYTEPDSYSSEKEWISFDFPYIFATILEGISSSCPLRKKQVP